MLKQLREETGAGVMDIKEVLEKVGEDVGKAKKELMKKGKAKAAKKAAERSVGDGLVYSYIHATGKVGSLVLVACETDFVAKTDDFNNLCKEIALQVCVGDYKNVKDLLKAEYIRDHEKKISALVAKASANLGEKIEIQDFARFAVE